MNILLIFVRKRRGKGGKETCGWRDGDILARGKLLRMIGDNHLLEEGALVLKQSLFGECKFGPTCIRGEEDEEEGETKERKGEDKKRKIIKLIKEMEDG